MIYRLHVSSKKTRVALLAGVVLTIVAGSMLAAYASAGRHPARVTVSQRATTHTDTPPSAAADSKDEAAEVPVRPADASMSASTPGSAPTTHSGADTPTAAPAAAPSSPSPSPAELPFAIGGVSLNGAQYYCSHGTVFLQVSSVTFRAVNGKGGTFAFQLEVTDPVNPQTTLPYDTQTITAGTIFKTIGSSMDPGVFYIGMARDGGGVRVHVTSPNDVLSGWLSVPAGTTQSCV